MSIICLAVDGRHDSGHDDTRNSERSCILLDLDKFEISSRSEHLDDGRCDIC
jgi:hypothetical protein